MRYSSWLLSRERKENSPGLCVVFERANEGTLNAGLLLLDLSCSSLRVLLRLFVRFLLE